MYCSTHAKVKNGTLRDDEEKYVDVGHKTCTFFDESTGKQCPIQAVFGLPSTKEKVYCSTHAKVKNGTLRDDEEKYVNVVTKTVRDVQGDAGVLQNRRQRFGERGRRYFH